MPPIHRIGVIGAGAWGTALAKHLAEKGLQTRLWAYERDVVDAIKSNRENQLFLPGVTPDSFTTHVATFYATAAPYLLGIGYPTVNREPQLRCYARPESCT